MKSAEPVVAIRYTTDGTVPTENSAVYKKPIKIKESSMFVAKSFGVNSESYPIYASFHKANTKWRLKIKDPYLNQYSGGSRRALIDQIRGNSDFRQDGAKKHNSCFTRGPTHRAGRWTSSTARINPSDVEHQVVLILRLKFKTTKNARGTASDVICQVANSGLRAEGPKS